MRMQTSKPNWFRAIIFFLISIFNLQEHLAVANREEIYGEGDIFHVKWTNKFKNELYN